MLPGGVRGVLTGFEDASTDVLLTTRRNLLAGLSRIAETLEVGTFEQVGSKGAAPPSQAGQLTLWLLQGVELELRLRAETVAPSV